MRRFGVPGAVVSVACAGALGIACGGGDGGHGGGEATGGGSAALGGASGNSATGGATNGGNAGVTTGGSGASAGGSNGGAAGGDGTAADGGPDGGPGTGNGAGGTRGSGGALGAGGDADAGVQTTRKLDVLFMIDNSVSMSDKQAVLAAAMPDFVTRITDSTLGIDDLHVGVITSSLGGHGATVCSGTSTTVQGEEEVDMGHLVGKRPRAASLGLTQGFVSWKPTDGTAALTTGVQGLVKAAGEFGCGFEASLESLYRFLVDPKPYASITVGPCSTGSSVQCAFPTGTDDALLAERKAFLRQDSALAIVILSDENDCSIRDSSQFYYAARSDITMPKSATACATNPNATCCYSCGSAPPPGCAADPACSPPLLDASKDALNLRCFDQLRRFGADFLYPVARYVNAFSHRLLCTSLVDLDDSGTCPDTNGDGAPDLITNPLFVDVPGTDEPGRVPSMVYLLGIVGVPWQTIAADKDANGQPIPVSNLRYSNASELAARGLWPVILGAPGASPPLPPSDALMVESVAPRTGKTPGTGESLAPPTAGYNANTVNGHEWGNPYNDDLQYACIFPLEKGRDCATILTGPQPTPACACGTSVNASSLDPLCQGPDGSYSTTQRAAKAYPGLRHLSLVQGLGDHAAAASICARNLTDSSRQDYGYRPAVDKLIDELARTVR